KQNVQSKGTGELAEGLTILTENVHKITVNNTITWTFKIDSTILEDSDFENFLVKKHDDKFSYFLVTYQVGENKANNEVPYKKVSLYPISEEKLKLDNLHLAKGDSFDWVEPDSGGGTTEEPCEGVYAGTEFQTCNQGGYHTAGTYCCQHYDFSTGQDGPHGCDYMKNFMGCGNTCTGTKEVAIYDFSHCNNDLPDGPSNDLPEPEDGMVGGDVTGGGGDIAE
ncbi:hypothetical protein V1T75_16390, partial [Tenacibaculum sp. FZY0031]|uniref:hypothetical protein n=1 Tax=Tenacibaculum sp. FZY0031 TaxID=3116648 RepID=UPI002EA6525F|nr:hypothetical protein [Tenacibaculum sp. FZY0031]